MVSHETGQDQVEQPWMVYAAFPEGRLVTRRSLNTAPSGETLNTMSNLLLLLILINACTYTVVIQFVHTPNTAAWSVLLCFRL